jgi:hypothetical protein
MKAIRNTILFIGSFFGLLYLVAYCENQKDPYEEGSHWNYSIECENGFVYKSLDQRRGTIQVLNSDGTPLKCGDKIY